MQLNVCTQEIINSENCFLFDILYFVIVLWAKVTENHSSLQSDWPRVLKKEKLLAAYLYTFVCV